MFPSISAGPGLRNCSAQRRGWSMRPWPITATSPARSMPSLPPGPELPTRPRRRGVANERCSRGEAPSPTRCTPCQKTVAHVMPDVRKVKLLLDEMHAPSIADALTEDSWDVVAVAAEAELRGMSDENLLARSAATGRALVTENVVDFVPL